MNVFPVYDAFAEDLGGNGLGLILPIRCTVEERMNGLYELICDVPLDGEGRHRLLAPGRMLKVRCPVSGATLLERAAGDREIEIWRVAHGSARLYADRSRRRTLARCHRGDLAEVLGSEDPLLWKVRLQESGTVGYMAPDRLSFFRRERLPGTGPWEAVRLQREQLFRIYAVERDTQLGTCTAWAQHVFYDLRGSIAAQGGPVEAWTDGDEVLRDLFAQALTPAPQAHRLILPETFDRPLKLDSAGKSFPQLLMEAGGALEQLGAVLYRDNFDFYVMRRRPVDAGVTLRRGKNLRGAVLTEDASCAATEIVAWARDEAGQWTRFGGDGAWRSPRAESLPVPRLRLLHCDLQLGDVRTPTVQDVYAAIGRQVQALWEDGADRPRQTLRAELVDIPAGQAQQAVNMFDTVRVIDEALRLDDRFVVTGCRWNAMRECHEALELTKL